MTVAPKTTAGEVQYEESHHDYTDDGEEELEADGQAPAAGDSWCFGSAGERLIKLALSRHSCCCLRRP